jgi:hypothetical protein
MKIKTTILSLVICLAMLWPIQIFAAESPPLPQAFYGSVTIGGSPAPAGTTIEARGTNVSLEIQGNPVITTESGYYGNSVSTRLVVQGNIEAGTLLSFYVNGRQAEQTAAWTSGENTHLDLSVKASASQGGIGGGGTTTTEPAVTANKGVTNVSGARDDKGQFLMEVKAASEDNTASVTVPEGVTGLTAGGEPLSEITCEPLEEDDEPSAGSFSILGQVYDFGPDGATFDQPVTITLAYDPDLLPGGLTESDLIISWYDVEKGEWVVLETTVDPVSHTVSASVTHFTAFAVMTAGETVTPSVPSGLAEFRISNLSINPLIAEAGERVTISAEVRNEGSESGEYSVVLKIDRETVETRVIELAAGEARTVSFSVVQQTAGTYEVSLAELSGSFVVNAETAISPAPSGEAASLDEPEPGNFKWWLIVPIAAFLVIVGLIIWRIRVKKAGV